MTLGLIARWTLLVRLIVAALAMVLVPSAAAQIVFSENFGTAAGIGPALPPGTTTYTYNGAMTGVFPDYLLDGEYTIGSNAQQAFTNWANVVDNTSGTGRMLIVNATAGTQDEFFRRRITLPANTSFELAAHLINVNSQGDKDFCDANQGGLILPNVRLRVETVGGVVLDSVDTGPIPFNAVPRWAQYFLRFTTPSSGTEVVLILSNNAPGGCGNDIALDDIVVRMPVTFQANDDAASVNDARAGVANVLNVLANDNDDNGPLPTFVLSATGVPPQLTFDTMTGAVGVVAGAATGAYSFTYEVCENAMRFNCDTAVVRITVANPAPAGSGICPAGRIAISEAGFGVSALFADNSNAPRAAGAPAPAGTNDTGEFSEVTYFSYIQIDLTGDPSILVPGNTPLTLSLTDAWNSGARAQIQVSADNMSYTTLGTIGQGGTLAGAWVSNTLRRNSVTVPGTGIRYVRIVQQAGGVRVDGAAFSEKCVTAPPPQPDIRMTKTSRTYVAAGFHLPGDDVVYEITVRNQGNGSPDAGSLFLVDRLPPQVAFYHADMDDAGTEASTPVHFIDSASRLNFVYARDVRFAAAGSIPANMNQCTYSPTSGYYTNVRYICINPQGVMAAGNPTPQWRVRFRAAIQ